MPPLRTLFRLHRTLGLIAALFFLVIVITGLLLNHAQALRLDSRYVSSSLLLSWYGIAPPDKLTAFLAGDHWITQLGERLYLDGQELHAHGSQLVGAAALPDMLLAAFATHLLLLTPQGEVIEDVSGAEGLPAEVRAVTADGEKVLLHTTRGDYRTDPQLLNWRQVQTGAEHWPKPQPLPTALLREVNEAYLGKGLPLERVLLDVHSGRIFGTAGVWVVDGAALILLTLVLSGVYMWLHRR